MKSNAYLYGENTDVPEVPAHICLERIDLLQHNLDELLKVEPEKRHRARIHYIHKAISFWEKMRDGDFNG
ncbi:hypothetical protein TPMD03_34 [Thiohalocapsa phage LS06-2018-MD03]|nr:hypothetical protein TPMD03_34 [Thiohalocapsa phage LS06-2018-MD03]